MHYDCFDSESSSLADQLNQLARLETQSDHQQDIEIKTILPISQSPYQFYFHCLKKWQSLPSSYANELFILKLYQKINHLSLTSHLRVQTPLQCFATRPRKVAIYTCFGVGDYLTMTGAIRFYALNSDEVVIFCLHSNATTVSALFADDPTIQVQSVDSEQEARDQIGFYATQSYQVFFTGYYLPYRTWSRFFYHDFYDEIKVPRSIRHELFYFPRDLKAEQQLYMDTVGSLCAGTPHIFIHDNPESYWRGRFIDYTFLENRSACIYHPNRNYYQSQPEHPYYSVWKGKGSNLLNYAKIIETADEIYVVDSSFFCLSAYLFQSLKARIKVVYGSTWYDITAYFHPSDRHRWIIK